MPPGIEALDAKIDIANGRLARIETLIETEAMRCPYREDIALANNNKDRLDTAEKKIDTLQGSIHNIRLKIAGWAGFAGIAAAIASEVMQSVF